MTDTPTPPQLKRPAFHAWIAPDGVDPDARPDQLLYVHLVIHHRDQLRAELEAHQHKLDPRKHPMHLSSLWLWAAAVRLGVYDKGYRDFKTDLVAYEPDKDREGPHTDDEPPADEHDARPTEASTS